MHRDLKPENLLIDKNRIIKISDFGLAKVYAEAESDTVREIAVDEWGKRKFTFTKTGSICGTPPYMSPEQWKGEKDLDVRSDIYSFGCVLYEMLTGRPPFLCSSLPEFEEHHLTKRPRPLRELEQSIPIRLDALLLKCLEKETEDRYRDFETIRDMVNDIYYEITGRKIEYQDEVEELNVAHLSNIAMSLQELGRSKEAISYYDRIVARIVDEVSPEMVARGFNNRGNCYWSLNDYEKALANYELAKRLDPDYDFPWYNSAGCFIDLGNYEKALEEINQAIRINPNYDASYARRAKIYLYFKNFKKAIEDCNQAVRLEPKNASAYRMRARAYEAIGENQKAIVDYEMVKRLEMS